jgi:hypothetical protein|tara:strand:- start:343 stop:510 length:168 start_codon:yes stop_codon:yes gene_type:complete
MLDLVLKLIQIIPWIVTGASLIASITPTPRDDVWIGKVYKLLDWCAINIGKAKDK